MELTLEQFIQKLQAFSEDKKKLPVVIDCPNGLEVAPKAKLRWNNPYEMLDKAPDKIVITWDGI